MATVITKAGEALMARKAQANEQLDIDTFIFANVPGQDPAAPIDRDEGVPPVAKQVHQQQVQQYGRISDNIVVYSTVLSSTTGPFEFNWLGLYSSVNQTLVAIQHVPTVTKTVTAPGVAGNTLNRNFGIEYSGIAELTGINVAPETWQLDFTARLAGMDELTRQLAADMNGRDWFINDGFKVEPRSTLNSFRVLPGVGYVSGLRIELENEHIFNVQSYPQNVYVDAWFDGTAESVWRPNMAFTVSNTEMDDYIDVNGVQHYVFKLAVLESASSVEDLRNIEGVAQKLNTHQLALQQSAADNDAAKGMALASDLYHLHLAQRQFGNQAYAHYDGSRLIIGSNIQDNVWREVKLSNAGELAVGIKTPYRVTAERIFKASGWLTVKDAQLSANWDVYNSGSTIYVGHETAQTSVAAETIQFSFDAGGNVQLCYTSGPDCGIAEVSLDGASPIEIDLYAPVITYRTFTDCFNDLEPGQHQIIVKTTDRKNPAASSTKVSISAIKITGSVSPASALHQPRHWLASEVLRKFDERVTSAGKVYYRDAAGPCPATEPTHTSGVVNGWGVQASTSFELIEQVISSPGSEREFKYDVRPEGQTEFTDVGGNVHGQEVLTSAPVVRIDDAVIDYADMQFHQGRRVSVIQDVVEFYGEYQSRIEFASVITRHSLDSASLAFSAEFTALMNYEVKQSYAAMWPINIYHGQKSMKNFVSVNTPRKRFNLKNFEGVTSGAPEKNHRDFYFTAVGRAFVAEGSAGVPSQSNGETGLLLGLKVNPLGVDYYQHSNVNAGFTPNVNGGIYSGYASWVGKIYVEHVGAAPKAITQGSEYCYEAEYSVQLGPNDINLVSL